MKTITLLVSMFLCISLNANAQNTEALASRIKSMNKETDPEKNVVSMFSIIRDFKLDTIKNAEDVDVLKGEVALSFLHAGIFPKFEYHISLIKNKFNQTSYLNTGAYWLLKSGTHLDYAEVVAQKTVELYDSFKNDPLARPADFPIEDWDRFIKMAIYPYYETYAEALHANGKDKTAFFYEEKALQDQQPEHLMQSSVELYAALLESQGYEDRAYDLLLKMAKVGQSSLRMDTQFKKLCIKKTGSEANAFVFLDSVQRNINKTYKVETAKKMITNQEAPNFSLLNMNGKRITLASLKGKIVVVDFWATWCAPCVASMPAMQKVVNEHPEVVFLFVATRENGKYEEAAARVKKYIEKNKFPINVLMDKSTGTNPNIFPMAAAYELTGIPTKIIIDKQGKLRFSTAGFTSDTELINELNAMIAIAKEQ